MVIDVFSKYGWIKPLADKKTETVSKAFDEIFKRKRKPQMLWTDKGSEFISKHFKIFWRKIRSNYFTLRMKRNQALLKNGRCSPQTTILFIGTNLINYLIITIIRDIQVWKWNPLKRVKRQMRKTFFQICTVIWFTWGLKNRSLQLEIKSLFQNTRGEYLIRVTHQTRQKRYSWLMRFCQPNL